MRILIDVTHPAYAHFFRAVIPTLLEHGHNLLVTSREKDVTTDLLDAYGIEHKCLSRTGRSRASLFREMIVRDWRLFREIRKFKPDVVLARDGVFACQAAWLAGVPSISFDDTDDARLQQKLYFPFASRIYTDELYRVRIGKKQRFYRGVSPLAYLHPDVFEPDKSVLERANVELSDRLIIVRLVSWTASHDYGEHGFDPEHLQGLIEKLSTYGRVLISSETSLPAKLEQYRVKIPAHDMHHLMAFASLYVGESATMAAEFAVLGKPAVYVSTRSTWYTQLLKTRFGLLRHVITAEDCLREAEQILRTPGFELLFLNKRDKYLSYTDDFRKIVLGAINEYNINNTI